MKWKKNSEAEVKELDKEMVSLRSELHIKQNSGC